MNMTSSARLPANVLSDTRRPDTTSGNSKSGARVPSASIVEGVRAIGQRSASIFAARMKSFSERPPIAWVESSIVSLR